MQIFNNANFDFIRWRWHALVLSSLVIIGRLGSRIARGGLPLGIDFSGGTLVVAAVPAAGQRGRRAQRARRAAGRQGRPAVRRPGQQRDPDPAAADARARNTGFDLEASSRGRPIAALEKANIGKFEVAQHGGRRARSIGEDLQRKGIYATLASIVGISHLHRAAVPA